MSARPPLPTRYAGPGASPGFLLWRVTNAWQRAVREALKPLGLTHTQFVVLAVATWFEGNDALTQARLAELSGGDVMTTSQVVRALVHAGLLARAPHPTDSRAHAVSVSRAGRALARRAVRAVERADERFFAPVRRERATVMRAFRLLAADGARD
ncbi:MAG: MarR family transcriptional regulator [Gemmatimonadetes bacterium]|nr:MarR family transcriptional regulator [Gemmatimonadota bacterium]